jgi:NADPH:quinone reductase-like Zn-dependent oxidoreductase
MRAVVHDRFGGPEVLRVAELDEPKTHVDSVLVRVKAAGLNTADLAIRAGALAQSVETLPGGTRLGRGGRRRARGAGRA